MTVEARRQKCRQVLIKTINGLNGQIIENKRILDEINLTKDDDGQFQTFVDGQYVNDRGGALHETEQDQGREVR